MQTTNNTISKNSIIHSLFEITVLLKGVSGFIEIIIGSVFLFFNEEVIHQAMLAITGYAIVQRSGHVTTNYLLRQANNFSESTKYFIAFYFLFYGVVNIFLVISLLKGKLWAYPAAIIFHIIFVIYQFYRFFVRHSGLLLFLAIFDVFLILLTWLEYKRIKNQRDQLPTLL